MIASITDFVKLSGLDKITGSRHVYRGEGGIMYALEDYMLNSLKELDKITGETLYLVDKGYSALSDYYNLIDDGIVREYDTLDFGDFKVYCGKGLIAMNAKEVILPPKKTIAISKKSRIYIVRSEEDRKLYRFPNLQYPKAISPLFKWLKKKKKIDFKVSEIFNIKENIEDWCEWEKTHHIPKWNLDSDAKINEYINYLEIEYFPKYMPGNKVTLLKNLIEVNITQEDINEFVNLSNNRYLVKR